MPEAVARYGEFGQALGLLAQAWNDLYGLTGRQGKRDVDHGSSLPVVAALALDGSGYKPGAPDSQVGELYALTQAQLFHRRAAQALARCPVPGQLGLFLDRYAIEHLLGGAMAGLHADNENDHAA